MENEHYLRTIMLFSFGSSYISKPILRRELKSHSNDLDSLLLDYKSKLKRELEPNQFDQLFPAAGKSDVDSWDIHMLTGVILTLFRTSLSLEEWKNLMIIKSLWKEFMVLSDSASPEEQYEDIQALLKDTLTSLSSGCDQSVQETCKAYIDKFSNGPFDKEAARRDLQQMQINDHFVMKVLKKWEKECMSNQTGIDIDESRTFTSTEIKTEDYTSFIEVEIDAGAMANTDRKERDCTAEIVLTEHGSYEEKTVANTERKAEELCTLILEDDTGKAGAMTITDCKGIDCTSILEADIGEAGAMAITDCKEVDSSKADEVDINEEVETRTECKAEEGCTEAAESGNSDTCNIDRTFRKSIRVLVSLMDPDPILDNAECNRILTYQQTKDIRELTTTSEKNRKIIERVRKRGKKGYTTFKECLKKTNQSFIVRVLECFETDGESPEALDEPYMLEEEATAVKNRDAVRQNTDLILRDAFHFLVTFMTPDPILDIAERTRLLSYIETRDIRERKTTSEKNRNIIDKVRQKGKEGYEQFKECLKRTQQLQIVEYLECSERQDLSESLATKIEETNKKEVIEERLRNQLIPNLTEKLNEIPAKNRSTQINLSTPVWIIVRGASKKVIICCEEELSVCFNNYKNSAEGNAEEIQQDVNELLAGVEEEGSIIYKSSERKCIILQFECKTYAAVLRFLNYMTGEQIQARLHALANSLKTKLQLKDELYVMAKLPLTCLDTLQNAIELGIASQQEQQYGDLAFDDDSKMIYKPVFERTLKLDLECTSIKGLSHLWNTFQVGRISKNLDGIAETFTRRYNTQVSLTSSVNLTEFRDALEKSHADSSKVDEVDINEEIETATRIKRQAEEQFYLKLAKSENENYVRIILLLLEGGSYIAKNILSRELGRQDLDALLLTFQSKLNHELHQKQFRKLFPVSGKTDINTWDLQMLTVVILNLFHHTLTREERSNLNILKHLRNNMLAGKSSAHLDYVEYEDIQDQLKVALTFLASGCDHTVRTECERLIRRYLSGPLYNDSTRRYLQQIKDIDEVFRKVLKILDQMMQSIPSISTSTSTSTAATSTAAISHLHEQMTDLKKYIGILERQMEKRKDKFDKEVKVATNVELTISGPSQELVDNIEKLITSIINGTDSSEGEYGEIKRHVKRLVTDFERKGIILKQSLRKCIILQFECTTYDAVLDFLCYMSSEKYQDWLGILAQTFKTIYQLEEELNISSKIPLSCLENLIGTVEKEWELALTDTQQHDDLNLLENANKTPAEVYNTSLKLELECRSLDGLSQLLDFFHEGKATNHLNGIAEALSSHFSTPVTLSSSLNLTDLKNALEMTCSAKTEIGIDRVVPTARTDGENLVFITGAFRYGFIWNTDGTKFGDMLEEAGLRVEKDTCKNNEEWIKHVDRAKYTIVCIDDSLWLSPIYDTAMVTNGKIICMLLTNRGSALEAVPYGLRSYPLYFYPVEALALIQHILDDISEEKRIYPEKSKIQSWKKQLIEPEHWLTTKEKQTETLQDIECELTHITSGLESIEIEIYVSTLWYPNVLLKLPKPYVGMKKRRQFSTTYLIGSCAPTGYEKGQFSDNGFIVCGLKSGLNDMQSDLLTLGGRRFRVLSRRQNEGHYTAIVEYIHDKPVEDLKELQNLSKSVYSECKRWFDSLPSAQQVHILGIFGNFPGPEADNSYGEDGTTWHWWMVAVVPIEANEKVNILAMDSYKERLLVLKKALGQCKTSLIEESITRKKPLTKPLRTSMETSRKSLMTVPSDITKTEGMEIHTIQEKNLVTGCATADQEVEIKKKTKSASIVHRKPKELVDHSALAAPDTETIKLARKDNEVDIDEMETEHKAEAKDGFEAKLISVADDIQFSFVTFSKKEVFGIGAEICTSENGEEFATLGAFAQFTKAGETDLCAIFSKHLACRLPNRKLYLKENGITREIGDLIEETLTDGPYDIAAARLRPEIKGMYDPRFKNSDNQPRQGVLCDSGFDLQGLPVHMFGARTALGKGLIDIPKLTFVRSETYIQLRDREPKTGEPVQRMAIPGDTGSIICSDTYDDDKVLVIAMLIGSNDTERKENTRSTYIAFPLREGIKQLERLTSGTFLLEGVLRDAV